MSLVSLTEFLVKQLLPNVENISVNKVSDDGGNVIKVLVPEECMSIVIGKGGTVANSIRTIVQASAYNQKLGRVRINIDSL